jgi:hypothetical protein
MRNSQSGMHPIAWRHLYDKIKTEAEGYSFFVETTDGSFVPVDEADSLASGVVGLVVAWLQKDLPPWEMEEPAEELCARLSSLHMDARVLLSRSLESFAGYYVSVRT